ncbi:ChaN family lipoprotein [Vibrio vulnificus]|uniref:ChaN family lipoprotein n=1 Tax=Vibrio vulnificus TaxID=672 RepID=UPI000D3E1C1D|nr:ChaN family lipoprotein [Vibrio vulnificus]EJO9869516.1 ChaN family lipoprotein [Vibrio vulnificus]MBN8140127.1 ChaN family lipoprotein [Vibrio vulnificus]MBN8149382.1 ChaN family lipoprotein [Vibrio vulnificus]MCA0763492.1 ChaN family lipoprotein [Vibrio vulnificus]MCA3881315.1 ChaN family lipoprotein [Vibrio vulnificus]
MRSTISLLLASMMLSGCANQALTSDPLSFYDYQLYSPEGTALSLQQLPQSVQNADVILIGEWHTHAGVHRFQTDLLKTLSTQHRVALSMEQFTRDKQTIVNQYLAGEIGEQVLIQQGNAWPNYESDYRPLIELAKSQQMDVIAANAPKSTVRCIGRQGLAYLDKLNQEERGYLASEINTGESEYKSKFMASMHHGKPEQTEKQFAAQVTWDETMAESIVNYRQQHPNTQVIHVAGKFHIEQGLGTAHSILRRDPYLKVVVISPVSSVDEQGSDYQLLVLEPPVRYVQKSNQMKAFQDLKKRNEDLTCK